MTTPQSQMVPVTPRTAPRLGLMAYTVLPQLLADLPGALARTAEIGFSGMETYGLLEHYPAARLRSELARAGLELTSSHTPFPAGADADRLLDESAELGAGTLVWSMEPEEFDSPALILAGVERVNEAAQRSADRGMQIAYHNHSAEFSNVFDGRQAYDILLEALDPRVVVELDMYWARRGGADPAEVAGRLGDRLRFVHLRDSRRESSGATVQVPIGEGDIDWRRALAANPAAVWHLIELDDLPGDPFDGARRSFEYLTAQRRSSEEVS
ncbi:sugar phosphate isomerase/epimerase family protein [Nakamurella endophytica]|uniref:Xylose isomerase n=1 Tax=Nakamurella endophytica TaxID=1748367 RepID=A0A917SV51_9ACTN|nr:sugar phosphate isomerase/epimerase [Nakamurella endophytica]GGL97562.1 xylose isomerase [Nakamurella endophytica]